MTPKHAATAALVRSGDDGIETLMLRRHSGHEFMPDKWVFPGGRVESRDRIADRSQRLADLNPEQAVKRLGGRIDEETAVGLHLAAIRETFEEARLLLAKRSDAADLVAIEEDETADEMERWRHRIDDGEAGLEELAGQRDLVFAADRLVYVAHWITPEFESRRYDTRFFVAKTPARQTARHDGTETTRGGWFTPQEAIRKYRAGELELAPPTLSTLEDFARFDGVDELIADIRSRPTPPAVHPHVLEEADEPTLVFPGDPQYPSGESDAGSMPGDSTRMVRRDGQWYSVSAP